MGFWAEQVVPRLSDTTKLARDARPPPSGLSGCRQSGRHRKFVGVDWLPPGSSSRSFRRGPAVAIVVRAVHGRTACRGHQSHNDHYGGHRGQPILSRCPRAQSRPVWPPSSGATTPPRPPSTGGSPPPTSTTSIARIDGHEQAPITEAARPLPDLHELTAPPKENEDRGI